MILAAALAAAPAANAAPKKNVVLFVSDDQGLEAGCYGNPVVIRTPNLDALAADGTRFTHAFCTTASCSASRSVILTGLQNHANGQYGHQHGYHQLPYAMITSTDFPSCCRGRLPDRLRRQVPRPAGSDLPLRRVFEQGDPRRRPQPGGDGRELPRVSRAKRTTVFSSTSAPPTPTAPARGLPTRITRGSSRTSTTPTT